MARFTGRELREHRRELNEARESRRAQEAANPPRALNVDAAAVQRRFEIVAALLLFYEFLTALHIPASALKRPPHGGWPSVTAERFAFLGKTDVAIDILKHIPYISEDEIFEDYYQIYEQCVCNDYVGTRFERMAVDYQSRDAVDPVDFMGDDSPWPNVKEPEHIITLGRSAKADVGHHMFLDTRNGSVVLVEFIDGRCTDEKPMRERFESLMRGFRNLTIFPIAADDVAIQGKSPLDETQFAQLKATYQMHGWPTSEYRKDECMLAIKELFRSFS
ncbi:hypothetical protein Slin14017_G043730 [Septoria linicola]|nr:hypothetical protein Slin14017_G043730 [Septoria linicola]